MGTQEDALERRRVSERLPEGGTWHYILADDKWIILSERNPWSRVIGRENPMKAAEYRSALATLGLSQLAAGRWLGVSPKTAQNYAKFGPSAPAAVAIRMALKYGLD